MEDIEQRLRESTDFCIKGFENWLKQNKNSESRENLMEAMHDVRKVLARVEIEIAISERDRNGSRPLPIPPHRSQRKRAGEGVEEGDISEDEFNAMDAAAEQAQQNQPRRPHGQHRGRRPMHGRGNQPQGNGGNE
jgi:hypothetical protein